jgi:hypothetical protein
MALGCKPRPALVGTTSLKNNKYDDILGLLNVTEQVANLLRQKKFIRLVKRYGAGCKPAPAKKVY